VEHLMPVIKNFRTIPELFKTMVLDYGRTADHCALKAKTGDKYQEISYDAVLQNTESLAMGLASLGVRRGDRIAIIAESRPEWLYSDMAILGIGAVDVPLYPISTSESISTIINNSESLGVIVSNRFHLNKVLKIWKECRSLRFIIVMNDSDVPEMKNVFSFSDIKILGQNYKRENPNFFLNSLSLSKEDDLCTIIYTSGTTGEPKGVMLTHKNIVSNVKSAHEVFDVNENDIFLSFLPLCHIFERTTGYYTAFSGGCIIAYAESIEKITQNMEEIKPTIMTVVPRLFERMYSKIMRNVENQPEAKQKIFNWAIEIGKEYASIMRNGDIPSITITLKHKLADRLALKKIRDITGGNIKYMVSGGAALPREHGLFFEALGLLVLEGYGLTESSPVIAVNRPNNYKFGTVGKPAPGVEVKIAKDGEILAYGPNIMLGYYKNKKETEDTIKDGWLHTGDIGVFDAEGFLIITDRKKHLFKTSGGKYVAPTPIENLFLGSKYIDQFILIGDRRMFLSALIVPDYEAVKEFADANRIQYKTVDDLVNMKQIYELLEKDLQQFQRKLAGHEKVRKFAILERPFTIEEGEMTPSLKLKRKVIEERYKELIEGMYKGMHD
jgi:long-chain acyl-CoA synthetase